MRHRASLLASLDGLSLPAFLVAKELAQANRAGLTPGFLSRKLDLPLLEVEYLIDVNHHLLYTDLTRIRLVPEGPQAIKRIRAGLESQGDVPALFRKLRTLPDQALQRIEESLGLNGPPKKVLQEEFLERIYAYPDAVTHYVASQGVSAAAREVFHLLWQSKDGIMPVADLYAAHGGAEPSIEAALWELLQACACFELFRFDAEERLVRSVALLKELRDYRRRHRCTTRTESGVLKPISGQIENRRSLEISLTDCICRLAAVISGVPVRLRNDGELFLADKRRLESIRSDEDEPSLGVCLWAAQGLNWLARVDNRLCAGDVDAIIDMHRLERHRRLYEWMVRHGIDPTLRGHIERALSGLKPGAWYVVMDFIAYAKALMDQSETPRLRQAGGHYEYVSASVSVRLEAQIARALGATYYWTGAVERGEINGEPCIRVTELGATLLSGENPQALCSRFPSQSCSFVVQPNFEIVVSGEDMDPLMTVPFETFAVRVGAGRMLVYRLDREKFVQAMQAGRNAERFIVFLLNHSRSGLPENVALTLRDWCGTAKHVRLRTYHVVEADDPLIIAELEHKDEWRTHVVPIESSKVLRYHGIARAQLKKVLEKEGYIVR